MRTQSFLVKIFVVQGRLPKLALVDLFTVRVSKVFHVFNYCSLWHVRKFFNSENWQDKTNPSSLHVGASARRLNSLGVPLARETKFLLWFECKLIASVNLS